MKKRMMSLLMALTMSLTLLPTTSYAAEESGTTIGTGELCEHHTAHDKVMRMAEGHNHCICGASHKAIGEHNGEDSVSFVRKLSNDDFTDMLVIDGEYADSEDIDGREYYVLPEGYYYLESDVIIKQSILIQGETVNICLNGHTLCLKHKSGQIWEVIQLRGGTLNLTDCKGTGQVCHFGGAFGRGVTVENSASFTLYGGTICNNKALASNSTTAQGGGVYIDSSSTFNMYGGTISNNGAYVPQTRANSGYGGGVYCAPNGTFNLLAGEITENQVCVENTGGSGWGGGVFNKGTFTMSGDSKISNNSITSSSSEGQYGGGVCNYNDSSDATFEMNGGEISGNYIDSWNGGSAYGGGVYNIKTFNFTGGTITSNRVQSERMDVFGGGVYNDQGGNFTMSCGTISNNATRTNGVSEGGGVCIYRSTFTMSGGEISGNQTLTYTSSAGNNSKDGGGIYFVKGTNGTFTLSGGRITGNTAKGKGAGICIYGYNGSDQENFYLSGNPYIWDNTTDNKQSNLYMYYRYDLNRPLTEGAKVGLSLKLVNTDNVMVNVASSITEDMSKYFASDDSAYTLEKSGSTIIRTPAHENVFSVDANKQQITAHCLSHADEDRGSLTISAPEAPVGQEKITYDGETKEAKITNTISDVTPKVTYTYEAVGAAESKPLSEGEKPINAGTYTASVSLTGADGNTATVSVSYQIDKATPTLTWEDPATEKTITYTGQKITTNDLPSVTVGLQNGETYNGEIQYSYRKKSDGSTSGSGDFSADIPKEVGAYEVKASIAADGNYTAAETSDTRTIIITKATPVIAEMPTASVLTYGQKLSDSTLTGGRATYNTGTEVAGTFAWKNGDIEPTAVNSGTTEYDVTFIPSDTHTYNVVDTKLTLTVNKAATVPNMPGNTMAPAHSTNKVGDITLPEGWIWQAADRDKELADGVGVTATAEYTGADKDNYNQVSVQIVITRSTCDHTNTEIRNPQEATCTQTGYTGDTYCKDCGEELATGTATVKKAHTVGTPATCVSKAVCSVCSETFGEVDAANHVHTTVKNRKEAICTQTGYTGDTYCTDCKQLLETGKELAELGHDYKATVTKQPTTTEEGVRTYTCTRCSSSYTESIEKLPEEQHTHNYTGSITKEATCTEAGVRTYTCSCGDSYTESIPATGHSYVSKVTKAATTTEEGIMTYTCSKCGHSYTHPIAKIKADDSSRDNGNQNPKPQTGTDNGNQNQKPQPDTDNGKDNGTSIKPYIKDDSNKEGWDVIKPQLEEAKSGDTVTVAMNGTTVVPKDVIDSIKGKDTTLVFDMGNGLSWKINGQDITDAAGDIDFDVTVGADAGKSIPVDVINNVAGEHSSLNLTLAYDGEFGFTATLTVNMESKNAGLYANLFYYNEQTGELEFISAGQIDPDGNVELVFTHASDYTIVVDAKIMSDNGQADNKSDETIPAPKTDDSTSKYAWNNTIIIIIGICIILIVFGAVFYVRKKSGSEEE